MARSGHIFPAAPASTPIMILLLFPGANLILLIHHWFLRPVRSQRPVLLGLRAHSCSLFPFEEQAPLGHRQPEGDEKSQAYSPQIDGIEVEVVHSCLSEFIRHQCSLKVARDIL